MFSLKFEKKQPLRQKIKIKLLLVCLVELIFKLKFIQHTQS